MTGQTDRIDIVVFDQSAFGRAEEFGQRVMQDDARDGRKKGGGFDGPTYCLLTKSMTMLPGSRWR